jgi:hypothetical protein
LKATVAGVTDPSQAYYETVRARLQSLLADRYGRGSTCTEPLSLYEAGIATGTFSALPDVLAQAGTESECGTNFQRETILARLDVLMEDLIRHPADVSGDRWPRRYGYRSAAAAGRAFRNQYGVGVGEARRVGQLGRWLAHAVRASAVDGREAQARQALLAFERLVGNRLLTRGKKALADLRAATPGSSPQGRPRYPRTRLNRRASESSPGRPEGPSDREAR